MADKDQTAAAVAAFEASQKRKAELKAKRDDARAAREGETKAQAFVRIGLRRTNSALDEIAKLRSLSNKTTYEYTEDQWSKIISALRAGIDKVEADFKAGGVARAESGFSL